MKRREFIALVGGAVAARSLLWPRAGRGQQAERSYRVGYLALLPGEDTTLEKLFAQRLQELGYSEGKNLKLEYRSAEGRPERLAELAAELIQANPDVLVAGFGTLAATAAAAATKTIPIVFTSVGDPVGAGLVASLAKPGANVTGLSAQASDIAAKRIQILEDMISSDKIIAVLSNPDTPFTASALRVVRSAAEQSHRRLAVFEARAPDQVAAGIEAAVKSGAAALLVLEDPLTLGMARKIAELVAAARLPTMYGIRIFPEAGGLMSYGPDQPQISRRAAEYVDKVLRGAWPADLPVEQPTKFEFVINMKAARELGLVLPSTMLALADEVIE
jgi:putative tryptophan/tyrosine transport system substrate-binding protein